MAKDPKKTAAQTQENGNGAQAKTDSAQAITNDAQAKTNSAQAITDGVHSQTDSTKKRSRLYTLLICFCLVLFAFSATMLVSKLISYARAETSYEQLNKDALIDDPTPDRVEWQYRVVDYQHLKELNSDYYCWIEIPGTRISYPVAADNNNDYYLTHTFTGIVNPAGSVFADYRCSKNLSGRNINILYAHRMNDGSMFYDLLHYDSADYYNSHKEMRIYTEQGVYIYEIVSVFVAKDDYDTYTFRLDSNAATLKYLKTQISRSLHKTAAEYDGEENIIVLSTCVLNDPSRRFVAICLQREFIPYPDNLF